MKRQKGFIVPLLAIIILLAVGAGVYVYKNKKVETPDVKNTAGTTTWITSSDMDYPSDVSVTPAVDGTWNGPTYTFPSSYFSGSSISSAKITSQTSVGNEPTPPNTTIEGLRIYKSPDGLSYVLGGAGNTTYALSIITSASADVNSTAYQNLKSIFDKMIDSQAKKFVTKNPGYQAQVDAAKAKAAEWKTYTNTQVGYSISYPYTSGINMSDPTCITISDNYKGATIFINAGFKSNSAEQSCGGHGTGLGTTDVYTTEKINIDGQTYSATGYYDSAERNHGIFTFNFTDKISVTIDDNWTYYSSSVTNQQYNDTLNSLKQILSTLKPISFPSVELNSISPSSASVGTKLEIKGKGLTGFEGDAYFFFERSDGKVIRLSGRNNYSNPTKTSVWLTLKEPCQPGETVYGDYSGIPAQCNYVQLTPGVYKVYTNPWGEKSNVLQFTITQ